MNEYMIRELTGSPEKLFALLERGGMGVLYDAGGFLYVLRGEAGWFLLAHEPGNPTFVKELMTDDSALRRAAWRAENLYHVDGWLRHDIYTLISALEEEILSHNPNLLARMRSQKQEGVRAL